MEQLSETLVKRHHMQWFEPIIQSQFLIIYLDVERPTLTHRKGK